MKLKLFYSIFSFTKLNFALCWCRRQNDAQDRDQPAAHSSSTGRHRSRLMSPSRRVVLLVHALACSAHGYTAASLPRGQQARPALMTASKKVLSADEAAASIEPLLKLASEHFASLALSAAVKLKLPDLIGDGTVTAAELAESLRSRGDADVVNEDALERTMRLLCASGVLDQCAEAPAGRGALYRLTPARCCRPELSSRAWLALSCTGPDRPCSAHGPSYPS